MYRRSICTRFGALFCLMLASASFSLAQDWPQWRGPNRDAKTTGFNVPPSWPKELTKKWQVTVGDGVATPALVGDKLYVFTRQDGKEILRCLDAATGNETWQKAYEAKAADRAAGSFPGPRSSPTVADGKVVSFGVRGVLCCVDAASGAELWKKDNFPDSYPQFFTSSSPIVVDGLCITQEGGDRDGGVIAYDLTTGDEKWKWMESGPGYGSPVLMDVDGARVLIAPTDDKLVVLAVADGKLMWEIPYKQGRYNSATPIVEGTTLVIAGPGTGLTAFKLRKDGDKLVEEKAWSNTENSVGFNTPVIKNGLMFGLSGASQLFCLNTETNKTTWSAPFTKAAAPAQEPPKTGVSEESRRVSATLVQFVQSDAQEEKGQAEERPRPDSDREGGSDRPRGEGRGRGRFGPGGFGGRGRGGGDRGYGSIVDVGSALIALTPGGELIAYKPSDEAFTELARYKVASEGTYAYPIPCAQGIYVKDKDALTLWTVE
jgi:outer membrane protein assembly factor BamB